MMTRLLLSLAAIAVVSWSASARADGSAPAASSTSALPFPTTTLSKEMSGVFCRVASFRDGLPLVVKPQQSAWVVVAPRSAGATAGVELRF